MLGLTMGLVAVLANTLFSKDWRTADRSSAGIAPDPAEVTTAVVQIYAARAFGWRSAFGVHTWVATKTENADHYIVHQVLGWRKWRGRSVVQRSADIPDRIWFDNPPTILASLQGDEAAALIPLIDRAASSYPYTDTYHVWPGPNSNTFIAHIGREVPALKLNLPPTAIGKDFLTRHPVFDTPPSGSGVQVSLFGVLGGLVSKVEGVEINLFGLNFGVGYSDTAVALRLPIIGVLSFDKNEAS